MSWDKLSFKEKAEIIKTGVRNGLRDIDSIRNAYSSFDDSYSSSKDGGKGLNKFDNGGYKEETPYSAGHLMDAIYNNSTIENLGEPSHHYDFTQSEEWADAHGYYPDARGHRDDRVKKESHPTHPSRGTWKSPYQFELSDKGMSDSNYTLFGLADGGQDPQATMTYNGGIVLPELTATPQGNYIYNPYDNLNIHKKAYGGNLFAPGGPTGDTPPSDGTLIYNGLVKGVKDIVHGIDNFAEQAEDPLLYTTMGLEGATVVAPNPYTAGAAYVTSLVGAGIDAWQGARALYKTGSAAINGDWETAKEEAKTAGQNGVELGLGLVGAKFAKKAANSYNVAEGTRTVTRKRVRTAGRKTKVVTKTGTVTAKSKAGEQALRAAAVNVPIEASQAYYHNREGISDFFAQQERLRQERIAMTQPVKRKKK